MKKLVFLYLFVGLSGFNALAQIQDSGRRIPKYILSPSSDTLTEFGIWDTVVIPQKSALEIEWEGQTDMGQNATLEKGSAGFFPMNGHAVGAGNYAFHATAARGTVIRVRNLNNNVVVFVKVLGPLPDAKRFSGCIIGMSDKIKRALGVQENKAFCELTYVGY